MIRVVEFNRRAVNPESEEPMKAYVVLDQIAAVLESDDGPDYSILRLNGGGKGIVVQGTPASILAQINPSEH